MNKPLALAIAATLLSVAPALADQPDSTFVPNDNSNSQGSGVGQASSAIIQNGQFVSGNNTAGIDQTTTPGSRAEAVQGILAAEGKGRDK